MDSRYHLSITAWIIFTLKILEEHPILIKSFQSYLFYWFQLPLQRCWRLLEMSFFSQKFALSVRIVFAIVRFCHLVNTSFYWQHSHFLFINCVQGDGYQNSHETISGWKWVIIPWDMWLSGQDIEPLKFQFQSSNTHNVNYLNKNLLTRDRLWSNNINKIMSLTHS